MSDKSTIDVLTAIQFVEDNGLSVYRPRKKERLFMKMYSEPLEQLLPKVSGNALKVFIALGNRMGFEDTVVEMSQLDIQKATNLHEHTVREALSELGILGVVTRIGPNIRRKYVLSEMYVKRGK
jgi:hypothetical protein